MQATTARRYTVNGHATMVLDPRDMTTEDLESVRDNGSNMDRPWVPAGWRKACDRELLRRYKAERKAAM